MQIIPVSAAAGERQGGLRALWCDPRERPEPKDQGGPHEQACRREGHQPPRPVGGIAAAGAVGAGALASCAPQTSGGAASTGGSASGTGTGTGEAGTQAGHLREGLPSFLEKPAPITDVKETKDFDVVVVGAGASGVPAALSALEAGASVALLQKESQAISQGNSGSGIDLATSDPADVANLVSQLIADSQHRANRALVELWAQNSGEAV